MIFAREFIEEDKEQLYDMISEINEYDGNFEGLDNVGRIKDYSQFLRELEISKDQALIHPDFSPQTTFGVFVDGKLVGGFNLRHVLKGVLINHGGNLGYLIRPSERKKGYGKQLLRLAREKARELGMNKILLTVRNDNAASIKLIESSGGVYENDFYDVQYGKTYRRYWLDCI